MLACYLCNEAIVSVLPTCIDNLLILLIPAVKSISFTAWHWNLIYLNIDICDFFGGERMGFSALKTLFEGSAFSSSLSYCSETSYLAKFFFHSDEILKINNQPKPSKQKKSPPKTPNKQIQIFKFLRNRDIQLLIFHFSIRSEFNFKGLL